VSPEDDRTPVPDMIKNIVEKLFGDKGPTIWINRICLSTKKQESR